MYNVMAITNLEPRAPQGCMQPLLAAAMTKPQFQKCSTCPPWCEACKYDTATSERIQSRAKRTKLCEDIHVRWGRVAKLGTYRQGARPAPRRRRAARPKESKRMQIKYGWVRGL